MPVTLNGIQRGELATILMGAFPPNHFKQLLLYRLDRNLVRLAASGDYDSVMYDVLEKAAAQYWIGDLLVAAREENPRHPALALFAMRWGAAIPQPETSSLEQIIRKTRSFLDVSNWRMALAALEGRVCRIEIPASGGTVFGTGFLVGPRAVMTNHHVIEPVLNHEATSTDVRLRFDYKVVGNAEQPGRVYSLDAGDGWLIDHSPHSDFDMSPNATGLPSEEELDHAILRLDQRIGEQPIGNGTSDASPRGWIALQEPAIVPEPNGTLHILQHPNGAPLKLAMGEESVLAVNANGTRVRYRTNTEGGSSGSPAFDENWNLIALHHSGDPRYPFFDHDAYNQGIPIHAIVRRLRRLAKLELLLA